MNWVDVPIEMEDEELSETMGTISVERIDYFYEYDSEHTCVVFSGGEDLLVKLPKEFFRSIIVSN